MAISKEETLGKINIFAQARLLLLLSLAFLIPFYFNIQWITGPIINAILIIVLFLSGRFAAYCAAFIPSLAAIAGGLLSPMMFFAVPFIVFSNILYIFSVDKVYNNFKNEFKGYWFGVIVGSLIKFLFIFISINVVAHFFIKQTMVVKMINMFSWPQLFNALLGGIIAWLFLKWLKRF